MQETTLRGHYRIIQNLGRGGFSETYLAKDIDLPGNPYCVVKLLKPMFMQHPQALETAARLFEREAQVLYRLGSHNQIPRLLAHFEENQEFYLVQEYVSGTVLSKEFVSGEKWTQNQAREFLQDVLQILEFVHKENVIHRDIKPANLIRRHLDNKIVLIDFGAVKEITNMIENSQGATRIGTRGFMPNEQENGNTQFNSDIFALGMTCIQGLTRVPSETLPRSPEITWNKQGINPQFAAILEKMICNDYRQRYQSVNEVLFALNKLEQASNHKSWWQNKKAMVGLLSAVVILPIAWKLTNNYANIDTQNNSPTNLPISTGLNNSQNTATYENQSYNVKINYPENWLKNDVGDKTTGELARFSLLSSNSNTTNTSSNNDSPVELILEIQNFDKPVTLEELTNLRVNEITQFFTDAKIHESHFTKLKNAPDISAHEVIYSGKDDKTDVKRKAVWLVKNNKAYIITYSAPERNYDTYLTTADAMINSLKLH
ncbi:MAG: serine/threonine protein kinase [Calothrix sp. CSU_2_0]|nr:serine/threonine protein kinase [Calothrix sp. CSU_2_0]